MPHVDIVMRPGRDDTRKMDIARKLQIFLAKELGIEERYVSVSIEDLDKKAMAAFRSSVCQEKTVFIRPWDQ